MGGEFSTGQIIYGGFFHRMNSPEGILCMSNFLLRGEVYFRGEISKEGRERICDKIL